MALAVVDAQRVKSITLGPSHGGGGGRVEPSGKQHDGPTAFLSVLGRWMVGHFDRGRSLIAPLFDSRLSCHNAGLPERRSPWDE